MFYLIEIGNCSGRCLIRKANFPTSSPPNQSPSDSPKRRWNLPNHPLGGPDLNSLLSSDPKPNFSNDLEGKKKRNQLKCDSNASSSSNQSKVSFVCFVLSIENWRLKSSIHFTCYFFCWLFCFHFNFVSAFQKATVSRDAHSAIFTLCWLTRSPNEKILKEDNNNSNNKKGKRRAT